MLDQYVADRVWIVLHRIYLFIDSPPQWLSQLGRDLTYSCHILCTVTSVVSEYNTDEVLP